MFSRVVTVSGQFESTLDEGILEPKMRLTSEASKLRSRPSKLAGARAEETMNSLGKLSLVLIGVLSAVGCGASADEGIDCGRDDCAHGSSPGESINLSAAPNADAIASTQQELHGDWATGPATWTQGERPRRLGTVADNICILSRLTGKYEGGGEYVSVTHDGTDWYLQGGSQQVGVAGEALCFPRKLFVGNSARTQISSEYAWQAFGNNCGFPAARDMYARDAFSFLSGLQGKLAGGGEYAFVQQAVNPTVPSYLQVNSCVRNDDLIAYARSFRVGAISSNMAEFIGPNGERDDVNGIPDYSILGNFRDATRVMAPTNQAICAFTYIRGKFQGGGEYVQIRSELVNGMSHWVLRAGQGDTAFSVGVGARCFARDQTVLN
jgi:hypothetical protein